MRTFPRLAVVTCCLALSAGRACGDAVIDNVLANAPLMGTVKTLGGLALAATKTDDALAQNKSEIHDKFFWAFLPDVHFTPREASVQDHEFDVMWNRLVETSKFFDVGEVQFVGCDAFAGFKCLDLYYVAVTPRGPVLFRFSMEVGVGDVARLRDVKAFSGWDEVKTVSRSIEHPVDANHVILVSRPKLTAATSQPGPTTK